MHATLILALTVNVLILANTIDMLVERRGPFLWWPAGRWRWLQRVWIAATALTSVAVIFDFVPPVWMPWVSIPPFAAMLIGSIVRRHLPHPVSQS